MNTPEYTLRNMTEDDLACCQRLSQQVGWNQLLDDWRRFLTLNPSGCFVAVGQRQILGTVCTVIYERSGWVAMVIVDQNHRRQGIGQQLLMAGIGHLEQHGVTVRLDATPAGKQLYDTLGFIDEYHEARYECEAIQLPAKNETNCQLLGIDQLEALDHFDRPIFGESRRSVLLSYLQYYPNHAFCLKTHNEIRGYLLARDGRQAFHIGPWAAYNTDEAYSLLCHCLNVRRPQRVFVDIPEPNPQARQMLQQLGFHLQRPFIRMYRGSQPNRGRLEWVYGLSGPELG